MDFALRVGRRLPRSAKRKAERADGDSARTLWRSVRDTRLRRYWTGARTHFREVRGPGLVGQEYVALESAPGFMVFPGGNSHHVGSAAQLGRRRAASAGLVRELPPL